MDRFHPEIDSELRKKLKWLMFFRVLFSSLLLGSTAILHLGRVVSPLSRPLIFLYGLIAAIFLLSFIYSILLYRIRRTLLFAYIQIGLDTIAVTLIIFMTGSFSSFFSFLYLLVIVYASMLLHRRGAMVMAVLCSIQYGILIDLEFYGFLQPFDLDANLAITEYAGSQILYRIVVTMMACFAVAFLSGLLSEQARRTRRELMVMEAHVKRVERMAAIGEMAAGLAHEIKNPLASLRGSIQMLQETRPPDSDEDRLMRIILREADRLSSLVSDFLLFARPPRGRREKIDLGRHIGETVDLFSQDTHCRAGIEIVTTISPDLHVFSLKMDPDHLRQILWNLLLNAADAIEGSGRIEIQAHPGRGRQTVIRISDTGCGMSRETVESIFDPFFTTKSSGTGLGLSIVHRIVESYDGWIGVESAPGQGTTFTLKLKGTDAD